MSTSNKQTKIKRRKKKTKTENPPDTFMSRLRKLHKCFKCTCLLSNSSIVAIAISMSSQISQGTCSLVYTQKSQLSISNRSQTGKVCKLALWKLKLVSELNKYSNISEQYLKYQPNKKKGKEKRNGE